MIFTRKTSNPYQSCTFSSLITWVLITYGHFFLTIVTIWFLNQIVLYITVPKTNIFVCVLNTYVEIFDFKAQSPTCRPVLNWRYGNETAISAQYKNHKYVQTSQTQGCKVFLLTFGSFSELDGAKYLWSCIQMCIPLYKDLWKR